MLDPIKVTLLTPGLGKGAKLGKSGIPAAVVSKYLWERGLVVEKTGLYSFLILFSLGITRGKWSTMVDALVDFKTDYDRNAPLAKTLPSVAAAGGHAYAGWGLRDLCDALHACYRDNDTAQRDERDVHRPAGAGDEAVRRLRPAGARRASSRCRSRS